MKQLLEHRDPKHPDMSPEAVEQRLREMAQLYKLGMVLKNPTWIWRGNIIESAQAGKDADGRVLEQTQLDR